MDIFVLVKDTFTTDLEKFYILVTNSNTIDSILYEQDTYCHALLL